MTHRAATSLSQPRERPKQPLRWVAANGELGILVISSIESAREYLPRSLDQQDGPIAVLARLPVLADQTLDAQSLKGRQIGLMDWHGPPFGAIVLDLHSGYSEADRLADLRGIPFVTRLRSKGCGVPVVMLSWFPPERIRVDSLVVCPSLFVRYWRSFALLQYPSSASEIATALRERAALSARELEGIEDLRVGLEALHRGRRN